MHLCALEADTARAHGIRHEALSGMKPRRRNAEHFQGSVKTLVRAITEVTFALGELYAAENSSMKQRRPHLNLILRKSQQMRCKMRVMSCDDFSTLSMGCAGAGARL
jgi:hypothetical protein